MNELEFSVLSMFNYQVFIIMGLIFEIIGALFLSMEAIGIHRFSTAYKVVYRFSNWSKKSYFRMSLSTFPFIAASTIGMILRSNFLVGLTFPLLCLVWLSSMLIDSPKYYEKWILIKTKEGKISPIGFIIIVFGNILQLISVTWQMYSRT